MGKGQDEQAVKVVHEVARKNGTSSSLTVEDLRSLGTLQGNASAAISRKLKTVNLDHVRPLFATRKMAWSTSVIIMCWLFIGLAYPLYFGYLPCTCHQSSIACFDEAQMVINLLLNLANFCMQTSNNSEVLSLGTARFT